MALTPVLSLVSIAPDASSITVKDTTGAYNSGTNPGGYGSPNLAQGDVTTVLFQVSSYGNLAVSKVYSPSSFSDLFGTGLGITAGNLTMGSVLKDGVYEVIYDVAGPRVSDAVTITPLDTSFLLTNANTLLQTAVGFILPDVDPAKVWYVDRTKSLSSAGGSVTEKFPDTGVITVFDCQFVYESDLKILISAAGNACLVQDIGKWADCQCPENTDFRDIWKRQTYKIARDTKFSQNLYYDAHNLAVKLASYCSHSKPSGCGCS